MNSLLCCVQQRVAFVGIWAEREVRDSNTLVIIYDWANKTKREADVNIFTAKNLRAMCKIEHVLLSHQNYDQHCQLDYTSTNVSSVCKAPLASIAYQFYEVIA